MGLGFNKLPTGDANLDRVQAQIADLARRIPAPSSPVIVTVTGDYKVTGNEDVLHVNAQQGPIRITLPKPSTSIKPLQVKQTNVPTPKSQVNTVTIATADGSKTIAGQASIALDKTGTGSVTLSCDGTQYWPSVTASASPTSTTYVAGPGIEISGNVISADAPATGVAAVLVTDPIESTGGRSPNLSLRIDSSLAVDGAGNLQRAALTGDATASAGDNVTTIPSKGKVYATSSDASFDYLGSKLVSTSGTVAVTPVSGGSLISLDVSGPGTTPTLAAVYAAGLTPATDDVMHSTAGDIRFAPDTTVPAFLAMSFTQVDGATGFSDDTPIVLLNQFCAPEGGDVYFHDLAQYNAGGVDPYRNPLTGFPPAWVPEVITTNNGPDAGGRTKFGWRRYLPFRGYTPFSVPSPNTPNNAFIHRLALHAINYGTTEMAELSALGVAEVLLRPTDNGVTAQLATHWDTSNLTVQAGDGPGWIISTRPSLEDFRDVRAIINPYSVTSSVAGAWGWRMHAYDGGALKVLMDVQPDIGARVYNGGLQLPEVDTTTFPVSDANSARLVWDPTLGKMRVSINGATYVDLSTVS